MTKVSSCQTLLHQIVRNLSNIFLKMFQPNSQAMHKVRLIPNQRRILTSTLLKTCGPQKFLLSQSKSLILGKHFNLKPKAKTESVENSEFWLSIGAHHSSVSISLTFLAALEPLAREFCSNFRLETLHAEDYYSTTGVTS